MSNNYVYRHIRLDKNEPFYIGIGSGDSYKRAHSKRGRSRFWTAISKKGYVVQILAENLIREEASIKEKEFIELYGRLDLKTGSLCNFTTGGDNNYSLSCLTKEKMRKAHTGLKQSTGCVEKRVEKLKGKKRTPEFCERIRLIKLGSKLPSLRRKRPEISIAKQQKVMNTDTHEIYESVNDMAKALHIHPLTATRWLKNPDKPFIKVKNIR
jgi:hypothetical protein